MRIRRAYASAWWIGTSSVPPIAPNTWMARSATRCSIAGTASLTSDTSRQAPWWPWRSSSQAHLSVSSFACSSSTRDSAIQRCTVSYSITRRPKVLRSAARASIRSIIRPARPTWRMQWCTRAGPRRICATLKPSPSAPSRFSTGTRTSTSSSSPIGATWSRRPIHSSSRTRRRPGASIGTMTTLWRRVRSPLSSVTPITISWLQRGCAAPVENHLRPLIT